MTDTDPGPDDESADVLEDAPAPQGAWHVEDVERQPSAALTYRNADGQPMATLMMDSLLLIGFHDPGSQQRIWEALCADVTHARGQAKFQATKLPPDYWETAQ